LRKSYSSRRREWYPKLKEKLDSSVDKNQVQSEIDNKNKEGEDILFNTTNK
jgi:hypothetical protein